MALSPMIKKISQVLSDGAAVETLFNEYNCLEGEFEKESFVLAV